MPLSVMLLLWLGNDYLSQLCLYAIQTMVLNSVLTHVVHTHCQCILRMRGCSIYVCIIYFIYIFCLWVGWGVFVYRVWTYRVHRFYSLSYMFDLYPLIHYISDCVLASVLCIINEFELFKLGYVYLGSYCQQTVTAVICHLPASFSRSPTLSFRLCH